MKRCAGCTSRPSASASASSAARRSASIVWTRCRTRGSASSARRKRKMVNAAERRLFWGTAAAVVIADFVTKLIAEALLARRLPLRVLGDVVQLRLVYNEGAAFGLHVGDNSRWIFLGHRGACCARATRARTARR